MLEKLTNRWALGLEVFLLKRELVDNSYKKKIVMVERDRNKGCGVLEIFDHITFDR